MTTQFLLYCLCGGIGVASDYATFLLFLSLFEGYQAANALGYLVGTLVSFTLNRHFTFGVRDRVALRLTSFLTVATLGYLASAFCLWLLVEFASIDERIAKILTLPVVVALQFTLNRLVTFRTGNEFRVAGK